MSKKVIVLLMGLLPATLLAGEIESNEEKLSYSYGYEFGHQLKQLLDQNQIEVDPAIFSRAVQDVLSGSKPAISVEMMQEVSRQDQEMRNKKEQEAVKRNRDAGEAYLTSNRTREGVVVTESGLQYRILKAGEGKSPSATDAVVVHYRGTLINGDEFDSSYSRKEPATFSLSGIIPGWKEVLQLMKVGAKWEVVIPSDLAYGPIGAGEMIGPDTTLIFEIELLEIK